MGDSQHLDEWTDAASAGTYTPLAKERLLEMFGWTAIYGPANSWTGTTGEAAAMIRELLRERIGLKERLEAALERIDDNMQSGMERDLCDE